MESLWQLLLGAGLGSCLILGGVLTVLQLPGTWFILVSATVYAWLTDHAVLGWGTLITLAVLATGAEAAEALAGMRGAARAGATRAAGWGALLGGFTGMILLTPLIPIPVVGSVLGGLLGCYGGAYVIEVRAHGDSRKGDRVGRGAIVGRLWGLLFKVGATLLMAAVVVGRLLPAAWSALWAAGVSGGPP